jgi:hypothetical protein
MFNPKATAGREEPSEPNTAAHKPDDHDPSGVSMERSAVVLTEKEGTKGSPFSVVIIFKT